MIHFKDSFKNAPDSFSVTYLLKFLFTDRLLVLCAFLLIFPATPLFANFFGIFPRVLWPYLLLIFTVSQLLSLTLLSFGAFISSVTVIAHVLKKGIHAVKDTPYWILSCYLFVCLGLIVGLSIPQEGYPAYSEVIPLLLQAIRTGQ